MSDQPELPFPPPGDRGGSTFSHPLDYVRLNRQANDVWRAMSDMQWHTLHGLSAQTGHPEASISARLRDFRKEQFGRHLVERDRITEGLYRYRLVPNPDVKINES
jgi:hypothetical protein